MHYTIPITYGTADGFQFPGEYAGQYGAYDAVRHIYSQSKELRPLLKDESLMISRNHFAAELERGVAGIR